MREPGRLQLQFNIILPLDNKAGRKMFYATAPGPEYFIFFTATVLAYMAAVSAVVMRMRNRHPKVWVALGEPSVLEGNPLTVIKILGFLFSNRYKQSDDVTLGVLVWASRILFAASVGMLLWAL